MKFSSHPFGGWVAVLCLLVVPLLAGEPVSDGTRSVAAASAGTAAPITESRSKRGQRSGERKRARKMKLLAPHERPVRPRLAAVYELAAKRLA